ncbi:phytanoyl-CoA dioxygenase family protein [uncultured Thiothrix sp.]|uniref:phytanoyl-CoA dioxygenase family protein n=1 Tax=uncultured Thiothrix sp. TaxID=223185 RepID=UPI0026140E97|nr:phytanoyl-CoA dioxygenase family protein [uncultured Thiothrix sp.]
MTLSAEQINKFKEDGYLIFDTQLPEATLDAISKRLAPYWGHDGKKFEGATYADFNRIQDAWRIDKGIKSIAVFPPILAVLKTLYGRQPRPFQTLNFYKGTEQTIHADNIHFNSEPFGLMCGVWVAFEDIGREQGPLVLYPGSQKLPEINFEQAGLEPNYSYYPQYEAFIAQLIKDKHMQAAYGLMKKGQALVWAANLLNGGAIQTNKTLTCQSQVTHYYFEGAKPWRPGHSKQKRAYFKPEWIPYEGAPTSLSDRFLNWFKR